MSYLPIITVLILLLAIIILGALLVAHVFKPIVTETPIVDELINSISLQEGWIPSDGKAVSEERGECLLYTTFSIETQVVDRLTPLGTYSDLPPEFRCDDGWTQSLSKLSHTCDQTECLGTDGRVYRKGEVEYFYKQCGTQEPCSSGRSAVILNFNLINGQVVSEARCLKWDNSNFSLSPCPPTTESPEYFLNVDMVPVDTSGQIKVLRIRAPGTLDCLIPELHKLTVQPCLDNENEGYTWIFIPRIDLNDVELYYPDQILELPENLDQYDLEDPNQIINLLVKSYSLQNKFGLLELELYASCPTYTESSYSCPYKSGVISAYSYGNIF